MLFIYPIYNVTLYVIYKVILNFMLLECTQYSKLMLLSDTLPLIDPPPLPPPVKKYLISFCASNIFCGLYNS